jgi:hypothetical protein
MDMNVCVCVCVCACLSRTLESTAEMRKTLRVTPRCGDGGVNAHETGEEINTNNMSIHIHTHTLTHSLNNMAISHNMFVSSNEPPPQQPSTHARTTDTVCTRKT